VDVFLLSCVFFFWGSGVCGDLSGCVVNSYLERDKGSVSIRIYFQVLMRTTPTKERLYQTLTKLCEVTHQARHAVFLYSGLLER